MHTTSTGEHGSHLLGKGYKAKEARNEHDPYAIAVLENVGEESGKWLWLRRLPLHCRAQGLHL